MADRLWVGNDTPGDLSVAANWSPAAVIADDDDVVFNATSNQSDITAGLDSHSGIEVESLHVHPTFTGKMGTSGSPLKLATTASGRIIYQGNAGFFYENKRPVAEQTYRLFIDTDNLDDVVEISGVIDDVVVIKGRVTGLVGWSGNELHVSFRNNPFNDAQFTLESSGGIPTVYQNGGIVTHTGATVLALNISSGVFTQSTAAGGMPNVTQTGGTVVYKSGTSMTTLRLLGGIFDMSQDGRAKTISNLSVAPGAIFRPNANTTIGSGSLNTNGSILPITDTTP